jgi:glycerate 2-kinase
MHILISPNAFKHSLNATAVVTALLDGLKNSGINATFTCFPVGDGGDGTGRLLAEKLNYKKIEIIVLDPLQRSINSFFWYLEKERAAIIEMADASGIHLLQKSELNPLKATSFGTGQLIKAAVNIGCKNITLCIGGSATVDGAMGILAALGTKFLDINNQDIGYLPENLMQLVDIDFSEMVNLKGIEFTILCDVKNTIFGENGSAKTFGPQKGATEKNIDFLEKGLSHLIEILNLKTVKKLENIIHGGAAGGVAAVLHGVFNADLVNGIDCYFEKTDFESAIKKADIVITGEGSLDRQTLEGKAPIGVAKLAKQYNKYVIGLAGNITIDDKAALSPFFDELININPHLTDLETALQNTETNLKRVGFEIGQQLKK